MSCLWQRAVRSASRCSWFTVTPLSLRRPRSPAPGRRGPACRPPSRRTAGRCSRRGRLRRGTQVARRPQTPATPRLGRKRPATQAWGRAAAAPAWPVAHQAVGRARPCPCSFTWSNTLAGARYVGQRPSSLSRPGRLSVCPRRFRGRWRTCGGPAGLNPRAPGSDHPVRPGRA
jgi:hypothetical protein